MNRALWGKALSNPLALVGFVIISSMLLLALVAPWLAPFDPNAIDVRAILLPPSNTHWMGTDGLGRDVFSRMLYGARISLLVGIVAVGIATAIGIVLGAVAGYYRGWCDVVIMRLVDLQLSFPTILMALMMLAILGKGVLNVVIALIIAEWATYARTVRATALVEREKEYIEAARMLRLPGWRILFRHLLPNCLAPVIVIATMQVARAIGLEATLSFLGLGASVTEPSLGMLISTGYQYLLTGLYWISFFPGIALLVTIVAINLVGDRLRDVLNPRNAS